MPRVSERSARRRDVLESAVRRLRLASRGDRSERPPDAYRSAVFRVGLAAHRYARSLAGDGFGLSGIRQDLEDAVRRGGGSRDGRPHFERAARWAWHAHNRTTSTPLSR